MRRRGGIGRGWRRRGHGRGRRNIDGRTALMGTLTFLVKTKIAEAFGAVVLH